MSAELGLHHSSRTGFAGLSCGLQLVGGPCSVRRRYRRATGLHRGARWHACGIQSPSRLSVLPGLAKCVETRRCGSQCRCAVEDELEIRAPDDVLMPYLMQRRFISRIGRSPALQETMMFVANGRF